MQLMLTVRTPHRRAKDENPRQFPVTVTENNEVVMDFADFTCALKIVRHSYNRTLILESIEEIPRRVHTTIVLDQVRKQGNK